MEHLNERDFRAIVSFLHENYSICGLEDFVNRVLSHLTQSIPVEFAAYCEMDPRKHASSNWLLPTDALSPHDERTWERHMHEHAVLTYNVRTGDGRARKISDFDSQRQFHRRGLYNELYRPLGVEDVLCLALPAPGRLMTGLAFHRNGRNFTKRDRLILNMLRPHLSQGRLNAVAVQRMERELRSLQGALEGLQCGVVGLDRAGRARVITPRAQGLLAEYFNDGRRPAFDLPELVRNWLRQQEIYLDRGDVRRPRLPMVVQRDGGRLSVRLLRGSDGSMLLLEEEKTAVDPQTLARLGISPRESEVLDWVRKGKTNREIGEILRASPRTVQKHLEHVFQKIGVETRTAAAVWFHQAIRGSLDTRD